MKTQCFSMICVPPICLAVFLEHCVTAPCVVWSQSKVCYSVLLVWSQSKAFFVLTGCSSSWTPDLLFRHRCHLTKTSTPSSYSRDWPTSIIRNKRPTPSNNSILYVTCQSNCPHYLATPKSNFWKKTKDTILADGWTCASDYVKILIATVTLWSHAGPSIHRVHGAKTDKTGSKVRVFCFVLSGDSLVFSSIVMTTRNYVW